MLSIIDFFHINIFLIFITLISVTIIIFFKFFFLLLALSFNFYPVDCLDLEFAWFFINFSFTLFSVLCFRNSLLPTFRSLKIFRFFFFTNFHYNKILLRQQGENSNSVIHFFIFSLNRRRKSFEIGISQNVLVKASVQMEKIIINFFNICFKTKIFIYSIIKFFYW